MLKKPSELFKKKGEDLSVIEQSLKTIDPDSTALKSFKENVQKINSLSDFSETLDNYRKSVDDVNNLSEEIADIRESIKQLLTAEDLDRAMMGQFVLVDQTVSDIQDKVKSINESKIQGIRKTVTSLTQTVNEFLEVDAPKYKKLFLDHERSIDRRQIQFEENINKAFETSIENIGTVVSEVYDEVISTVDQRIVGINDNHLKSIIEEVKAISQDQEGKNKKLIVDGEIRIDERYKNFQSDINSKCDDLTSIIGQLTENVSSVEGDYADVVVILNEKLNDVANIKNSFAKIKKSFNEQQNEISEYTKEIKEEVRDLKADIARTDKHIKEQEAYVVGYEGYKDQVDKEVNLLRETIEQQQSSNEEYQDRINILKGEIDKQLKQVVERVGDQQTYNEHYQGKIDSRVKFQEETAEEYKQEIDESLLGHQQDVNKKIKELKKQYKLYETSLTENVQQAIEKLDLDNVEKKNHELSNKINYLEELFEKFSEKALLTENIITEPPSTKNSDPQTPLDQNFVTFDQLNAHYRTFINRIQQQLSTLGGGGEVRLEFLDDVDRATAKVDGKFLKYEASSGKWVGATGGGGASFSGTSGQILQHNGSEYVGVSSVGIATFVNDYHQGYYRYSTNYYTTGVANTVQNLPADEFVMIQPSVRTNKVDFLPEKMLIANNNNPWIGAGATIGTGQTQFSLAGLDDGSTVIVRIAGQVDPDVDNTNVDFALNFTTNPTTQGYGTTNFSITKEQALICNEGADQNYISETLFNFYVGSSLSGLTTATAGSFNVSVRASDECDFEMMALTINVVA